MKIGCSIFYFLSFLFVSLLLISNEVGGQNNPRRRQRNRNTPRRNEGLPTEIQEAYLSAVDDQDSTSEQAGVSGVAVEQADEPAGQESIRSATSDSNPSWDLYAPSTPASNAVECYVEVVSVRSQGGRCTRLGGMHRPYICQSGQHFEFNRQCQQIIEARNANNPEPGK